MEEDLTIVRPRDNVVVFKASGHCTNGGCMTLHVCVYVCVCMLCGVCMQNVCMQNVCHIIMYMYSI